MPGPRLNAAYYAAPGAKREKTRNPGFYEGVSDYLTDLSVPQV